MSRDRPGGPPDSDRPAGEPNRVEPTGTDTDRPERPLGVRLLTWGLWFWAGAIVMIFVGIAAGEGPVLLGGEPVPREEALRTITPALTPMLFAALGAALALTTERSWARPAAALPFITAAFTPALSGLGREGPRALAGALFFLVPVILVLVAYLYMQPSAQAYFRRLREEQRLDGQERE